MDGDFGEEVLMPFTVEVNNSAFPEGTEFTISGLGVIPNGSSVEVDENMEREYIAQVGRPMAEGEEGNVKITGSSSLSEEEVASMLPPQEEEAPPPAIGQKPSDQEEVPVQELSQEEAANVVKEGGE
jgi:hypothetical protein